MADDEAETWLPLNEASRRLVMTVDALRSRVRRGLIESRKGNDGRIVVRVSDQSATGHDVVANEADDLLRQELIEARAEADHWRTRAEQARNEATDHKARLDGKDAVITSLREQLDRERDRADRLEAELRRPFWRRWFG
jgi:chromosome segregation ATPase